MQSENIPTNTQLFTRRQAANYLGIKENTLAVWATTKRHPLCAATNRCH